MAYSNCCRLLTVLSAAILLFISACGGSRVVLSPTLNVSSKISSSEGVVVARFIHAGKTERRFNFITLTPENFSSSNNANRIRIEAIKDFSGGGSIFASKVKSGQYSVRNFLSYYVIDEKVYQRDLFLQKNFGNFTVKPGHTTDLGTIVYYPKTVNGKKTGLFVRVPNLESFEVLENYLPFYRFDKSNILGWNEDKLNEKMMSSFEAIYRNPLTYYKSYVSPNGTLYLLAKFGVIVSRSPDGHWNLEKLNTNLKTFVHKIQNCKKSLWWQGIED